MYDLNPIPSKTHWADYFLVPAGLEGDGQLDAGLEWFKRRIMISTSDPIDSLIAGVMSDREREDEGIPAAPLGYKIVRAQASTIDEDDDDIVEDTVDPRIADLDKPIANDDFGLGELIMELDRRKQIATFAGGTLHLDWSTEGVVRTSIVYPETL